MVKGIDVKDILKALPAEGRAEFAGKLKREAGVQVAFTVSGQGRKRKHRWGTVKGKVVAVRFTERQYAALEKQADDNNVSVGSWLKLLGLTRASLLQEHGSGYSISVDFTYEQYARLETNAAGKGISVQDYVRTRSLQINPDGTVSSHHGINRKTGKKY